MWVTLLAPAVTVPQALATALLLLQWQQGDLTQGCLYCQHQHRVSGDSGKTTRSFSSHLHMSTSQNWKIFLILQSAFRWLCWNELNLRIVMMVASTYWASTWIIAYNLCGNLGDGYCYLPSRRAYGSIEIKPLAQAHTVSVREGSESGVWIIAHPGPSYALPKPGGTCSDDLSHSVQVHWALLPHGRNPSVLFPPLDHWQGFPT